MTSAIRLGSKGAKPRLFKISRKKFNSKELHKAKKQEHSKDVQKIYITPDLTPKQQKEQGFRKQNCGVESLKEEL